MVFDIFFKTKECKLRSTKFNFRKKKSDFSLKAKNLSNKNLRINYLANKILFSEYQYLIVNLFIIAIIKIIKSNVQLVLINDSFITFKIKQKSTVKLFNTDNKKNDCQNLTLPNIIEFNGINYTNIDFNYQIKSNSDNEQEVKLIWGKNNEPKSTNCLFQLCSNIIDIDFSNFNTSQVKSMHRMFFQCSSLISLNLSNFDTSKVTHMHTVFAYCSSLKYLNLSNFDTSQVVSMESLFYNCSSLVSLDISSFNTSKVGNMANMFRNCTSLTIVDLSNFDTSNVRTITHMFNTCKSLISLNLSNFDTRHVENMDWMFSGCRNLTILDISNFNTSNVKEFDGMFNYCESLISLNLSKFETSKAINMYKMFNDCRSLKFLDISNFNTTNVTLMYNMFCNCQKLESLNLSHFNTINVVNMSYLFSGCSSLSNLDISNFNTMNVEKMDYMFNNCNNLTSLNLFHFDTSKVTNMQRMFFNCSSLIFLNISNFDTSKVIIMNSMFYNCHSLKSLDLTNFNTSNVNHMGSLFKNCYSINSLNLKNFDTSKVKYMDNMFANCINLTSLNLSNFIIDKAINIEKMFINCSNLIYINLKLAKINNKVGTTYIFRYMNKDLIICSESEKWSNLLSNEHLTINCINMKNNKSSIKCYKKLMSDENNNNNNICDFCGLNYLKEFNYKLNVINCYKQCSYYHYFDINSNEMFCLDNCSGIYNKLIKEKKECIEDCKKDDVYNYELKKEYNIICVNKSIFATEQKNQIMSEINKTKLENGNDEEIKEDNIIIALTTTSNQKNNENINKTTINLGECEYKLKWYYNISINDSLYIIKIDLKEEGMKIPKIEYEVYYSFNSSNNLTKLNLSICKNNKIAVSIPVIINDNLDKYNISSSYYNDICIIATSKNGTDITLSDRENEFIDNNMTLCEENCKLIEYNYINKKAKCSCDIKIKSSNVDEIKFGKDLLKKSFIDINNMINVKIMKCYKNVFKKNNLKDNLGFFINLGIVILFIICSFIFIFKSFGQLYLDIKEIILAKRNTKFKKNINNTTRIKKKKKYKKNKKIKKSKKKSISNNEDKINSNNILTDSSKKKIEFKNLTNDLMLSNDIKNKNILEYKDYELNSLDFEKALIYDKRNFLQYYISSIKINNLLLFSFIPIKDYNVMIIKIFLFFFFFTLNLTVNAIFFNDDTMHKIYIDGGKYNLIYQIPQILYSSIISGIFNTLIKYLSLSQDNIMDFKHTSGINLNEKGKKLLITLKIKFIIFFIVTTLFLMFFWFYISCFCGIYKNTQFHLMKDSILGFILSLFDPFWQCLFLGIVRIYSLKNKKEYLYKFYLFFENLS